jgi:hypothetical protein
VNIQPLLVTCCRLLVGEGGLNSGETGMNTLEK